MRCDGENGVKKEASQQNQKKKGGNRASSETHLHNVMLIQVIRLVVSVQFHVN